MLADLNVDVPQYDIVVWPFTLGLLAVFFSSKRFFARRFVGAEGLARASTWMSLAGLATVWLLTLAVLISLPKTSEPTVHGAGLLASMIGWTSFGPSDVPHLLFTPLPACFFGCICLDATFGRFA